MKIRTHRSHFAILTLCFTFICFGQKDPGVRGGPAGAGGPIAGLTDNEKALFKEGILRTTQLESVCDTCSDVPLGGDPGQDPNLQTLTNSSGLGARFNGDQCSVCHQQPAIGGSGGFLVPNPQDPPNKHRKPENPMFDLIPHRKGGQNQAPSFITQYGPIREVRFQRKPDGTPDGGVHALFTIVGRSDIGAPGCTAAALPSTDFETQYRQGNLSFRIPLQTFGLGLIEAIQDITILNTSAATASLRAPLGIGGMPNRSGNDGTIARFGWKAQNKSLAIFAGEAYNVEMGVTNDLFPNRRDETPACTQRVNELILIESEDDRTGGSIIARLAGLFCDLLEVFEADGGPRILDRQLILSGRRRQARMLRRDWIAADVPIEQALHIGAGQPVVALLEAGADEGEP
jgi:Di-haem oxidoreductase, putative peroxidase